MGLSRCLRTDMMFIFRRRRLREGTLILTIIEVAFWRRCLEGKSLSNVRHLSQLLSETGSNRSQPRSGQDTLDENCHKCGQGVLQSFIFISNTEHLGRFYAKKWQRCIAILQCRILVNFQHENFTRTSQNRQKRPWIKGSSEHYGSFLH